jgi:hypothetical protein
VELIVASVSPAAKFPRIKPLADFNPDAIPGIAAAIGLGLAACEQGRRVRYATTAAIVDRITFNAHIIETGTQSYRLATSKTSNRKRAS